MAAAVGAVAEAFNASRSSVKVLPTLPVLPFATVCVCRPTGCLVWHTFARVRGPFSASTKVSRRPFRDSR